jgi:hypothetical protein
MDFEDHEFRTIAAAPVEPLPNSQKKLNGGNLHSGLAPDYLLKRAELLFACYRKDEAHDPQTYSAAVAALLGDGYSRSIVEYVTLPSRQKFLPTVAEVREACDARAAHVARMDRYSELKTIPRPPPQTVCLPGQITYKEFLEKAAKGETKPRPIGAFEPGGYLGPRREG